MPQPCAVAASEAGTDGGVVSPGGGGGAGGVVAVAVFE
jgi:hypothetical protein